MLAITSGISSRGFVTALDTRERNESPFLKVGRRGKPEVHDRELFVEA